MAAKYRQCLLEKSGTFQRVWIPLEFAKEGKVLKIRTGETWEDGWKVFEAGKSIMSQETLNLQRSNQRDIAEVLEGH
jgi:hypothetical protein